MPLRKLISLPHQHWAQSERHVNCGVTPFGLPETRLLLTGSYICVGVAVEKIDGDTLKDKIETVIGDQGYTTFLANAKVEGSGFWFIHDEEFTCVNIPAGHIVFTCGHHDTAKDACGASGIRWSTLRKQKDEVQAASVRMQEILKTYPDLKGDEYTAWLDCLTKFMEPSLV